MEAAVRTVYELVAGEPLGQLNLSEVRGFDTLRLTTLEVTPSPSGALGPALDAAGHKGPLPLRIGVVNGLGEAKKVVKAVEAGELAVDFVEVMACPGGAHAAPFADCSLAETSCFTGHSMSVHRI